MYRNRIFKNRGKTILCYMLKFVIEAGSLQRFLNVKILLHDVIESFRFHVLKNSFIHAPVGLLCSNPSFVFTDAIINLTKQCIDNPIWDMLTGLIQKLGERK